MTIGPTGPATTLVGCLALAVMLSACSGSDAPPSATPLEATSPSTPALPLSDWTAQLCETAQEVEPALSTQEPSVSSNGSDEELGHLQAWLTERAAARRSLAAAFRAPIEGDLDVVGDFATLNADALDWKADWNDAARAKLVSLDAPDAAAFWETLSDSTAEEFTALVPSPLPDTTAREEGPEADRQMAEVGTYFDQNPGCDDLLGLQVGAGK